MRRALSYCFVFSVNYLLLASLIGLLATGMALLPVPRSTSLFAALTLFAPGLSLLYLFGRAYWPWASPGEAWLGNDGKANLRQQRHGFTVSRIPLLLLVVLTLLLTSNLAGGAATMATLAWSDALLLATAFGVQYYAITSFLWRPRWQPVLLLAACLLGLSMVFRLGYQNLMVADLEELPTSYAVSSFGALGLAWLLVGGAYARRHIPTV